jgi:four helix bundle protein
VARFETLDIAHSIIVSLRRLLEEIGREDPDLARQVRRAAQSIVFNVAEGGGRGGRDRRRHWRYAAGSAAEVDAGLRIAVALGYVGDADEPLALLDRVRAMLWRLTH